MQELPALSQTLALLDEHRGVVTMKDSIGRAVSALKSDSRAVRANALQASSSPGRSPIHESRFLPQAAWICTFECALMMCTGLLMLLPLQ